MCNRKATFNPVGVIISQLTNSGGGCAARLKTCVSSLWCLFLYQIEPPPPHLCNFFKKPTSGRKAGSVCSEWLAIFACLFHATSIAVSMFPETLLLLHKSQTQLLLTCVVPWIQRLRLQLRLRVTNAKCCVCMPCSVQLHLALYTSLE